MDKKNKFFERFVAKAQIINPNLSFNEEDWNNIGKDNMIRAYCNLHKRQFNMRRSAGLLHKNCKLCNKDDYTEEEIKNIEDKFKEIDEKYREDRKKDVCERYDSLKDKNYVLFRTVKVKN